MPSLEIRLAHMPGEEPDADGVELVTNKTCFHDTFLDFLAESKEMHVTWIPFIPTNPINSNKETNLHTKVSLPECVGLPRYSNLSLRHILFSQPSRVHCPISTIGLQKRIHMA